MMLTGIGRRYLAEISIVVRDLDEGLSRKLTKQLQSIGVPSPFKLVPHFMQNNASSGKLEADFGQNKLFTSPLD